MVSSPRKIVFNVPYLLPEAGRARAGDAPARGAAPAEAGSHPDGGQDVRKLAMLVEVSQALTGTLNLPAGLYGVLEVLERRCGALRGAVTLLEEASGMLVVEARAGLSQAFGPRALPHRRRSDRDASTAWRSRARGRSPAPRPPSSVEMGATRSWKEG